jgi:hypothetical protein
MIDRGEHAEHEQRGRQQERRRRDSSADERDAAAEIERRHHVAPAPAVGKPAGRQREQPERDEGRGGELDHLRIGSLEHDFEPDHDGRSQQHEVIDRMGEVEERDGPQLGDLW